MMSSSKTNIFTGHYSSRRLQRYIMFQGPSCSRFDPGTFLLEYFLYNAHKIPHIFLRILSPCSIFYVMIWLSNDFSKFHLFFCVDDSLEPVDSNGYPNGSWANLWVTLASLVSMNSSRRVDYGGTHDDARILHVPIFGFGTPGFQEHINFLWKYIQSCILIDFITLMERHIDLGPDWDPGARVLGPESRIVLLGET